MGKLAEKRGTAQVTRKRRELLRLREERRKLESRLAKLDARIAGLGPAGAKKAPTVADIDRWLDELSDGPALPRLPADFARADLYDDHD